MQTSQGGGWFDSTLALRRRASRSRGTPVLAILAVIGGGLWALDAGADLAGATVNGTLRFPWGAPGNFEGPNYFDPINGFVPAGYGNSSSPTIVLSGAGQGNFAFELGGSNSWLAQFDGAQLAVTFNVISPTQRLSGSQMTFQSTAFLGLSIARIGSDDFLNSGNGGMAATLDGDTITLTVAPQCLGGSGCTWPLPAYTNTYSLAAGPQLAALTLTTTEVAGCKSVSGKVTLSLPAPAAGTVVTISDTLASATPPVSVTVPAGATTKTFSIKTTQLAAPGETGTVSATLGGTTLSQSLTVRPIGLTSVTLTPTSAVGGNQVVGKATLECKAGPGPVTVDLSSNNAAVASPVAASIVVPQGLQSANFDVATNAVLAKSAATISGTANGIKKSKVLTVTPAAVVSPISLKFGNVTVGTASAPLNATLTNKGAVPFSVTGISITGTYASWFAQTNDCPASLPAGASCSIGVTFSPAAAASKSAKLTIATSATSTPLSVSVSGAGI